MLLPGATQVARPGIGRPYRLTVPWRWALHAIQCDPNYDPTSLARTHANPPHFWVSMPRRIIVQTVDTDLAARALAHPEGTVETNHARAIQVEIAGRAEDVATYPADWWTWLRDALLVPVAAHHGINLAHQPPLWAESARSYGTRSQTRMTDAEWLSFDGLCGHQHVPANSHWDPGPIPAHLLAPTGAPEPEELTVADVAKIMAKLDALDAEVAATRAGVLQAALNVTAEVDKAVAEAQGAITDLLNGAAALVRRGDRKVFIYGGRRHDVTSLTVPEQVELKGHFGVERDSAQVSDPVWAVIEAVTTDQP